jgi:cytochrome c
MLANVAITMVFSARALAQEGPNLGLEATPEMIAGWNISIPPDGSGLPAGSGTADTGASVYAVTCLACHGPEGQGGAYGDLVGGLGTIDQPRPVKTVGSYWPYATTVFDYIRRSMPYQQPHTLTDDEVYAVTAYLLSLNGIIGENDVMNAQSLPRVEMPNRDGFIPSYPERPSFTEEPPR